MFCRIAFVTLTVTIFLFIQTGTSTTLIDVCPGSDVLTIRKRASRSEVALIFYYASWNHESRRAKALYAELAQYHIANVYFAAVDCWHFACNCSRTYEVTGTLGTGAPHKWPTLMVRYGRGTSLEYHGEWNFSALTRFLENLFRPLERIHSKQELRTLSSRCDGVVLGVFTHSDSLEYRKFVVAAVKWLETDPERSYRFAVVLGATAFDIVNGMSVVMPQILLISRQAIEVFNDTSVASGRINTKWSAEQILSWTQAGLKRAFSHVSGYSTPATLAARIRHGPVLLVFANDLSFPQHFYAVMESMTQPVNSAQSTYTECAAYWRNANAKKEYDFQLKLDTVDNSHTHCIRQELMRGHELQEYYFINEQLNHLFKLYKYDNNNEMSSGKRLVDGNGYSSSAENLLKRHQFSRCLIHPHHYHSPEVRIGIAKFLKKCADKLQADAPPPRNRTLSVIILNTAKYEDYLTTLSMPYSRHDAAAISIIDPRLESIFVMHEPFTYDTLMRFVQSYYATNLIATRQTNSIFQFVPSTLNAIYLRDYNRQMFLNLIDQHNVTSVVLLYAPTCAFSSIMSHTLAQLSVFLQADDIKFIRLNTQANDLPWEFVMPTTPTLLVFPRDRPSESRTFPTHLKVNVRNMLGFILAQMEPADQVKTVWSSCKRTLQPQRLQKCLHFAKTLVMQHISHHLKFWQIFENDRHFVLNRLKEFKDLSLNIQRSFKG